MNDYSIEAKYENECPHDEGFYTDDDMFPQELCVRCGYSRLRNVPDKWTYASHSTSKLYEIVWT